MQGGTNTDYTVGHRWNVSYDFTISTFDDDETSYRLNDKTYLFQLRTHHREHEFWNGLSESVMVTIYDKSDTNIWKEKSCYIVCDPHMSTFDSQRYELQRPGVYTAFQHSTFPIQVQVKSTLCKGTAWSSAHCICGVAVIVGKSYHILDLCDKKKKRVNYICGKHDELQVIPRDNVFEFRVPTGLKITATRRFKNFWDIVLYPTVLEVNSTSGLCGSLDNNRCNDFTHRDGSMPIDACTKPWWYHPNDFTESFKLLDSEHMFQDEDYEVDKLVKEFPDYPDSQQLCFCPYNDKEEKAASLGTKETRQESVCGFRHYASCSKNETPCQKRHLSLRRQRRSTFANQTVENYRYNQSHVLITKRSTMTETEARIFCEAQMSQNPLRIQCEEMNVDNSDTEIENCVLDIMATGDTEWAGAASDRASQVCLTEVKKNVTIQESFPESASLVRNLTCPNNCTNNGICENGECSCSEGFATADCSVDLTISPNVDDLNLGPDPICDVRVDCFEVYVNGGDFPSNRTYICRYSMFHVDNNGSRSFAGYSEVPGRQRNIYQVTCPLTYAERHEDVFVLEYQLFLKMDDNSFSSGLPFIVLDSTCQGFIESTGKYSYFPESGYCFINGTCYEEEAKKTNDTCQRCVSSSNPYAWTTASDADECATVVESDPDSTSSSDGNVPLIIALTLLTIICVAAIVVTLLATFKWTKHIPNSQTSGSQPTLSQHPKSCQDTPTKADSWPSSSRKINMF
ncbi:uncharacterized protein LOC110465323 [Mizuhopecten yessoensis]|uniref:uncharacterized protein LOC110465323 n=1 Tax=Mizuhopecten yessoensis TaxID=6573 RepID=UPI000B457510|nr:uncharacterized protein LOC110465323 [Mizuhopecten yessoensis]XP_021376729.1 uncharacterized protein LOC110465323 [Mizuhopecten yessoensis]